MSDTGCPSSEMEPPAKRVKVEVNPNHAEREEESFSQDVDINAQEPTTTISTDKFTNYVTAEEVERLREFQVLDELGSNDGDSDRDEDDSSDGKSEGVPEEEIEKMLDENLPEDLRGAPKPKEKAYITRQKIVLEEKGVNHFEVLPLDWMMVRHYSGMPVYMHRSTRVCTLAKPYFLGKGNTRRHDIPISAIPCLAYRKALEEEEKQQEIDKHIEEQIKSGTVHKPTDKNKENVHNTLLNGIIHTKNSNSEQRNTLNRNEVNLQTNTRNSNNDDNSSSIDIPSKCPFSKKLKEVNKFQLNNMVIFPIDRKSESKSEQSKTDSSLASGEEIDVKIETQLDENFDVQKNYMETVIVNTNQHDDEIKIINENAQVSIENNKKGKAKKTKKKEKGNKKKKKESIKDTSQDEENTSQNNVIKTNDASQNDEISTSETNDISNSVEIVNQSETVKEAVSHNEPERESDIKNEPEQEGNSNNEQGKEGEAASASDDVADIPLNRQPVVLPDGKMMRPPRVSTPGSSWQCQHLTPDQLTQYCSKLFKFNTLNIMHFKRWADRRKYTKARKALQYPTLPEGTKLITIPAQPAAPGDKVGGGQCKRDWVMNMNGRSYLSVFHEYVRRALNKQPVYEFKQLENASQPYQATVYIGGMQYGVGTGTSKRAAKANAATASIHILIPEMRDQLLQSGKEADNSFFDCVGIEDPRITEFCAATCEPSPHAILRTCLLRNFGAGDRHIHTEMKKLEYQKIELTMKVGKHSATVVCKNKKSAKQRASQAILQALHPHVRSWGSLLRLYGSRSVKSCKEKKLEEQQITLLQDAARQNEPNYAVLEKLRNEMRKLRERDEAVVSIGTLLVKDDLPTHSGSNLNNVDL